ncbi:MAG: hypothetical protein N3B17_01140 [Chlorobi bacterium]|nr:hypothetical protein [Chlorobiota bacterium]
MRALLAILAMAIGVLARGQCTDELLLDGSEPLVRSELDSTGLWWAIVQPFAGQQRLVVGGYRAPVADRITPPAISADGMHWAAWLQRAGTWFLLVDTVVTSVQCASPGIVQFAPNAPVLVVSCMEGATEFLAHRGSQYTIVRRVGDVVLSPDGTTCAWVERVERQQRLMLDGREIAAGDEFRIGGFWHDGRLLYAQRAGGQWRIVRGSEELAGPFNDVPAVLVNRFGTAAVVHAVLNDWHSTLLISDDYARPLPSQQYERLWSVVLHPWLPQYGAVGVRQNTYYVIHTGTEYGVGRYPLEQVTFTPDGSELYGIGCDVDCFIVLDGQRIQLGQDLSTKLRIARRPKSHTFAYSTPTNMFVRRLDKNSFTYSRMCDDVQPPIFNRRRNRYEALGTVQGRLYLLICP